MRFYVSGPVVEERSKKETLGRIYLVIESALKGHTVDLPLRSRDIDNLSPSDFFKAVLKLIKSSDAVITVLVDKDQSGPVEATIASSTSKPQCIVDTSSGAARLLRGLPGVSEVSQITLKDMDAQVRECVERFLRTLTPNKTAP